MDARWDPAGIIGIEDEDLEGEGEIFETDEAEKDCAPIRVAIDPGAPTAEDIEEHRAAGHCPYRSWCEWCVKGRGVGKQHRSGPDSRIPVVSFDYLIVTKRGIHTKTKHQDA